MHIKNKWHGKGHEEQLYFFISCFMTTYSTSWYLGVLHPSSRMQSLKVKGVFSGFKRTPSWINSGKFLSWWFNWHPGIAKLLISWASMAPPPPPPSWHKIPTWCTKYGWRNYVWLGSASECLVCLPNEQGLGDSSTESVSVHSWICGGKSF